MYPIKFSPIKKEMIWGSESWEITCRPQETGIVENGEYAGQTFAEIISKDPAGVLGVLFKDKKFPLLIKIIDARDALSVQVHPCDEYARLNAKNGDTGKSELWYILEPPSDGYLIIGTKKGVTREILARAYENGTVGEQLERVKVCRGDIVNIPAGLIHALTPGTVVAEIQQNSDITYRLYDYGRLGLDGKPRELHIQDALNVIDFAGRIPKAITEYVNCPHFMVSKHILEATRTENSNPQAFSILMNVGGTLTISYENGALTLPERRSVFIPAGLGTYELTPNSHAIVLSCTVPAHI
jgi:mannose-6-phosphate isomerase